MERKIVFLDKIDCNLKMCTEITDVVKQLNRQVLRFVGVMREYIEFNSPLTDIRTVITECIFMSQTVIALYQ